MRSRAGASDAGRIESHIECRLTNALPQLDTHTTSTSRILTDTIFEMPRSCIVMP